MIASQFGLKFSSAWGTELLLFLLLLHARPVREMAQAGPLARPGLDYPASERDAQVLVLRAARRAQPRRDPGRHLLLGAAHVRVAAVDVHRAAPGEAHG